MEKRIEAFLKLAKLFQDNDKKLYLVGGTVRDYLMDNELSDMDAVTDATPDEMKVFLYELKTDFTFSKYGSIKIFFDDIKFDVTTLRKETTYSDARHPSDIVFVKSLEEDYVRRDFTINAMYLDSSLKLIDYVGGKQDLEKHILRMVGDPEIRLAEDPLRIIRAIRFALTYNLEFDSQLKTAILNNISLLDKLNPDKVVQDLKKTGKHDKEKATKLFNEFSIKHLLDVID